MDTILITGGSRGIGAAVAKKAIGKYNVAVFYCNSKEKAFALREELSAQGAIEAFSCDVSSSESVRAAVASVKKRFGRIDVLVNCAGVALSKLFIDLTDEDWRKVFAVNVDGAFFVTREVLPGMISRGRGSIVNVASIWGEKGAAMEVAYSSSKAALIGMTKALAKEVAESGVRVNAVSPGAIDTDMMKSYSPDEIKALKNEIPLGRLGSPEEVADAILFAAESSYIIGADFTVNGGW